MASSAPSAKETPARSALRRSRYSQVASVLVSGAGMNWASWRRVRWRKVSHTVTNSFSSPRSRRYQRGAPGGELRVDLDQQVSGTRPGVAAGPEDRTGAQPLGEQWLRQDLAHPGRIGPGIRPLPPGTHPPVG